MKKPWIKNGHWNGLQAGMASHALLDGFMCAALDKVFLGWSHA